MQRLAQRGAGMLLVELRPEQRQQAVTAVEALGPCGGEVGEEREASGLAEGGPYVAAIGAGEAQPPEHAELDHARPRRTRRGSEPHEQRGAAVTAGVTVASQGRDAALLNWLRERKASPAARAQQSHLTGEAR